MKIVTTIIAFVLVALAKADEDAGALREASETAAGEPAHDRELSKYWYYKGYDGKACRTNDGKKGEEGYHFKRYHDKSLEWCFDYCSDHSDCKAFEWYDDDKHCEIWWKWYGKYEVKQG